MRPAMVPNHQLRDARMAVPSSSGSGRPMSRQELADACNAELAKKYGALGRGCPWAGFTEKTIGALERGEIRWPNSDYRDALCAVLKLDARSLGLYIDRPVQSDVDDEPCVERVVDLASSASGAPLAAHIDDAEQLLGWSVGQSAAEALSFAARAASSMDAQTTSDLFEQVKYIARDYASEHRWQTFTRARSVRDLAFDFSNRTRRPDDLVDVYMLASLSSLLMSSAAFDLGHPSAALGLAIDACGSRGLGARLAGDVVQLAEPAGGRARAA